MQADMGLVYCKPDWQKTLQSFEAIEDNNKKMLLEPFPDEKVLAAFAQLSYTACTGELNLPKGWQLLTTARSNSWTNGYFGCAFWNSSEQQVVVAHRGTDPKKLGALWVDGKGVYCNSYTKHMSSGVTFADDVKKAVLDTNQRYGSRFVLSFTGHSLGAWLSGVTTLTVKHLKREGSGFCRVASPREGLHAHTLTLDSPGVKDMLMKIYRDYDERYNRSICTKKLDITIIFASPNPVNCTGFHVGDIYQLENVNTHSIDNFIKAFDEGKKKLSVQNWPQGLVERQDHDELEMYMSLLDNVRVPPASLSRSHQNTEPLEVDADSTLLEELLTSRKYKTKPSLGNICHLGVFSAEEFNFMKNWSFYQSNTLMKLKKIEKFTKKQNLNKLYIPPFEIDTKENIIICKTMEDLGKVIRETKQLLRWFPEQIINALAKQNKSIKSGPLYMAGQAYLRTLPDILDCEDTMGLESFLVSSKRVLQIETSDPKFEAARLNNILLQIKNTSLDAIYLKDNCHTILSWNDLTSIAMDIDMEGLNESDVIINNLLVLEFTSPTDNLNQNYEILTKILKTLETHIHKKLVIILPQSIDSQLFMDFKKLAIETKSFKEFELNDLTVTSREYIFARDSIALGEEILSLNKLLGEDCKADDEQVRNKINSLISPILKKLAMDTQYMVKIPKNLQKLCELDGLFSKGNKIVDKANIAALLERREADGPLLVISDPEQLSQDYWGEGAEAAGGKVFTTEDDGQDLFLKQCREESARVLYWLHLRAEGLSLRGIFNSGLYMPRKFHARFIIKSMDEFVHYSGNKDIFIFNNAKDKLSFISSFNVSKECEKIFVSKEHFKLKTEDIMKEESLNKHDFKIQNIGGKINKEEIINKHYFEKLEIRGSPCLVWQYSHGSLDGLRPFITRDYRDPIEEDAFSNTRKKLTIIADDPGMGKTTSLTRMSELIRDSWVLRIDHNHLTAIDKLPSILNLQSVTKCLIHASGLPTDDDFLHNLLLHCLESDSSRQICILVDAFDEITKENSKVKTLQFLKYLKNTTNCKTVVTTRVHPQEWLENELSEFSAELQKITETEQDDFMVNFWLPHLALELPEYRESEKRRLRQFARELREEVEGVLGEEVASLMGVPLQIRMLAEVFLQQAIQSVVSLEQAQNSCKITNLYDLYTQFIKVKKSIYFEQKSIFNKGLPDSFLNDMVTKIMEKHCVLAFQSLDPKFAAEYFSNTILSNQDLQDISSLGLIKARIDGTVTFIHRTFEEYFCADFFVQWLRQRRQTKENNNLVKSELCVFLLRPDYYLIRKFIETQLAISTPIQSDALESNPILYKHWSEHRQLFFHDHVKTPLHVAAEEQNMHTVAVLLSGPSSKISEEDYICFMAVRDKAGRTALNIALENRNLNIVKQIKENVENCSYESLLYLILASFVDFEGDRDHSLFCEYSSNKQPSSSLHRALTRTEQIRKQITLFMVAVREDDRSTVNKILRGMESDTEQAHLLIAIDSQGDTAINLAASKKDHILFKLFAKQGVCMSFDASEMNPLHCAAKEGNLDIVKYLLNLPKNSFERQKRKAPLETLKDFFLNFIKHVIDNDNHTDEKATAFLHTGIHQMFSSIKSKDGSTAMMLAAQGGHYEIVSILVEKLADIHVRDNNGWTALMLAACEGHVKVVELLLLKGADIHMRNNNGWTALMLAAGTGYLEVVELLILNGADLNSQDVIGHSALMAASNNGHLATVRKLLEKGASIHILSNAGSTALMLATSKGHLEVVELLLSNGADLNSHNKKSLSALIIASTNGHLATVHKLLEKGADIHTSGIDGYTALMLAASEGRLEVTELLLLKGADIHKRGDDGCTSLILAANNGHIEVVELLLSNGADLNSHNKEGCSALLVTAHNGHLATVRKLLEKGADIHMRNNHGWTALMLAASEGHLEVIELLMLKGANIHISDNEGWTALMLAVSEGHLEIVELLLSNGANFNSHKKDGLSALLIAAINGHLATVHKLLENGADIHIRSNDGGSALMLAASQGHLEVVELLMLNGADIHLIDNNGSTALIAAAINGHLKVVKLLLFKDADIHIGDNDGCTALMIAAYEGHLEIVELLLLKGADIQVRDSNGVTALMLAAYVGHLEVVKHLLLNGADIHIRDNDGCTALMLAASKGHLEVVEFLLLKGADINTGDNDGCTALILAAKERYLEVIELLLLKGADIHVRDNNGSNTLMAAASKGYLEVIELLLTKGADIHVRDNNGCSALMLAAYVGHLEVIEILLMKGADICMRNNNDWTALMLAAYVGHLEVVELLLLKGAGIHKRYNYVLTALMLAVGKGRLKVVELLLLKGADIHIRDNDGWTALMLAASEGHLEVVELLLLKGADIHKRDNDGLTALMLAASKGYLEIVELLLSNGADLNSHNKEGRSALLVAVHNGNLETIRKLLEKGADIHIRDNDGCTALMLAAKDGHLEIVELLLLNSADLNSQNKFGYSALLLAVINGHLATVCKLLEKGADIHTRDNFGWTALNQAAGYGRLDVAKLLLLNGADLNSRDEDGDTAFLQAAAGGHTEMVVLLLQHGVDVNSQRDDGRTALSWAAHEGHVNIVEVLLQHNADVSYQDKDGKTALSWAEEKGHGEVAALIRCHQEANSME